MTRFSVKTHRETAVVNQIDLPSTTMRAKKTTPMPLLSLQSVEFSSKRTPFLSASSNPTAVEQPGLEAPVSDKLKTTEETPTSWQTTSRTDFSHAQY